jgi:hypothetical protein
MIPDTTKINSAQGKGRVSPRVFNEQQAVEAVQRKTNNF